MTAQEVLDAEVEAFTGLIEMINDLGSQISDVSAARSHIQNDCRRGSVASIMGRQPGDQSRPEKSIELEV